MNSAKNCNGSGGLDFAVKISDFYFKYVLDLPISPPNEEEGEP
jgi:hypothetical protein